MPELAAGRCHPGSPELGVGRSRVGSQPQRPLPAGTSQRLPEPPFSHPLSEGANPSFTGLPGRPSEKESKCLGKSKMLQEEGKSFLCVKLQKKPMVVRASSRELQRTWSHCWDRTESLDSAAGRDVPPRKAMLMHDSHDRQTRPHWETGSLLGSSS